MDFVKFNSIKDYINETLEIRSSDDAANKITNELNTLIETMLREAKQTATEDNRKTIMERDIVPVLEKHLGKKHLTWKETVEEIIQKNPTDLGKISKTINAHIEKQK